MMMPVKDQLRKPLLTRVQPDPQELHQPSLNHII
jgi:hypothetical protein